MMTRNTLFAIEQEAEDMKTIKSYLALDPKHTISYLFGPYLRHELSYDAKKGFCLQAYLNGEALFDSPQPHKIFDDELKGAIAYAKNTEPSEKYKDTFANKWDEIQKVTDLNMGVKLVETYSKRNPSYHFDYDPTQAHITFYGRNHKYLNRFRSKQILYPCQKFGSSRYSQFRHFKYKTIERAKTKSDLPF